MNYLQPYLMLSSILFSMGIYAVITRKNAVAILMGIELILNASNINFVAFNRFGNFATLDGHVFTMFVIVLAAAEAASTPACPPPITIIFSLLISIII